MPTANLKVYSEVNMPPSGVYITRIIIDEKTYFGAVNIGTHPTIGSSQEISVDTHIINFNENIYTKHITLELYEKIRCTRKFENISLLLSEIRQDCITAGKYFGIRTDTSVLHMDIKKRKAVLGSQAIQLTSKEFDVLYMLYSSPDTVFTKEQIYSAVWQEAPNGFCHAVENTVFQIRKKLRILSKDKTYINTVSGYGYSFSQV